MPGVDRFYYAWRAKAELEAAETANDHRAANPHYLLAGFYLDLVHNSAATTEPVTFHLPVQPASPNR